MSPRKTTVCKGCGLTFQWPNSGHPPAHDFKNCRDPLNRRGRTVEERLRRLEQEIFGP